ncbi:MAG TPA: DUF2726 domain-containing protein [Anaerolineales bacterium]|nr:DUF2726 domain-containing protein [Anaerolineales bacterium]
MKSNKADTRLPYRLREPFLTTTELALFRMLKEMMGGRYVICPKVALNDIFYILRPNENVHFFNKIFRKHVDFLLCDPLTFAPSFGVEIVKPIARDGVREADKFMDELFTDAGVPLVHIPSAERYDASDVIALFQLAVAKIGGTSSLRIDQPSDTVPNCPVCGKMMVLRIHRNGSDTGRKYYGCMDSPRCAGVVAID